MRGSASCGPAAPFYLREDDAGVGGEISLREPPTACAYRSSYRRGDERNTPSPANPWAAAAAQPRPSGRDEGGGGEEALSEIEQAKQARLAAARALDEKSNAASFNARKKSVHASAWGVRAERPRSSPPCPAHAAALQTHAHPPRTPPPRPRAPHAPTPSCCQGVSFGTGAIAADTAAPPAESPLKAALSMGALASMGDVARAAVRAKQASCHRVVVDRSSNRRVSALELPAATATLLSAPTGAMRKALTSPDQNDARRQYQEGSTLPAWRSGRLTAAGAGAPISIDATGLVGGRFGSKNAERKAMYLEQMKREEKWSTGRRCTIAPPPGKPPAPGLARGGSSWDLLRGANVGRPTPGLARACSSWDLLRGCMQTR